MNLPDEETLDRMETLLSVASDSTRLKILYCLIGQEKNVSQLVEEVGASQSLISHQLQVLRKAHLVSTRKDGTKVFYLLADDHVSSLLSVVYAHTTEAK